MVVRVLLTLRLFFLVVVRTGRKTGLNVCLDGIKCGTGYKDTWVTSLQQIHMITPQVARSIALEYPTIRSLYDGYKECASVYDAWCMLEGIRVSFFFNFLTAGKETENLELTLFFS